MLSRTVPRRFFAQHNVPIVPQGAIIPPVATPALRVGYLLCRQPVVQHAPHPLEYELAVAVDREMRRYPRHPGADTATHFMQQRGLSIDVLNRQDVAAIQRDMFGLDAHREAMRTTAERYEPARRLTPADFFDPCDPALAEQPPKRQTLQRRLDDYLYLIVRGAASGKWTVPARGRQPGHSLRTAVEAAIIADHGGALDAYLFGNAPLAVVADAPPGEGAAAAVASPPAPSGSVPPQLFLFTATYLSGRPSFGAAMQPAVADHAWVTRRELADYEFELPGMFAALRDITTDTVLLD
jgi:hypothetical protein